LHDLATGYADAANSVKTYADRAAEINVEADKNIAAIHGQTQAMADDAIAAFKAGGAHKAAADAVHGAGDEAKQATPNFNALAKAMGDDAVKAAAKFDDLLRKSSENLIGILGKLNPMQKIYSDYAKSVAEANDVYQKEIELA